MLTVYYPTYPSEEMIENLRRKVDGTARIFTREIPKDAQMLIDGRPAAELLDNMARLRWVVVPFAGVPEATLELLRQSTIRNSKSELSLHNLHHNAAETAELAVSLLLAAAKLIVPMDRKMRRNDWSPRYDPSRVVLLEGKRALVLGYGEIGKRVARACLGLGMNVVALKRSGDVQADRAVDIRPISLLREALAVADALIICLPQTMETTGLVGAAELARMPIGAILVNIARAKIVDEEALFLALKEGRLHSAGLDVWYAYPEAGPSVPNYYTMPETARSTAPSRFPFHNLQNVVMSPHRAGVSMETESRRVAHLARLIAAAANGEDVPNQVDLERGY